MKESILGRSKFSTILRMVGLTGFLFFIGLGTTVAQNYISTDEALSVLRTELSQVSSDLNLNTRADEVIPQALFPTQPQYAANWAISDIAYNLMQVPGADVKGVIDDSIEKLETIGDGLSFFYIDSAGDYLKELLSE